MRGGRRAERRRGRTIGENDEALGGAEKVAGGAHGEMRIGGGGSDGR